MARNRNEERGRLSLLNVGIHPEVHHLIHIEAVKQRLTIQEAVHEILTKHLGRRDIPYKPARSARRETMTV